MTGVPASWAASVEHWHATSTLTPKIRDGYRSVLAKIGRWLAAEHPEITEPGQWTRQTCASWVAAVDRMAVGDFSQWTDGMRSQDRLGKPLTPQSKSGYLKVPRAFFRDLHEWESIPRRLDPAHALRTPRSVRALMGPDPRVIADDIWAKLLWAGLNVEPGDLPTADGRTYPVELIRAITLAWLFAGQRSDEIARLRVGCIRWQHDGLPIPGDSGEVLARDAVCLLDVPTHKTGTAFKSRPVGDLGEEVPEPDAQNRQPAEGRRRVRRPAPSLGRRAVPGLGHARPPTRARLRKARSALGVADHLGGDHAYDQAHHPQAVTADRSADIPRERPRLTAIRTTATHSHQFRALPRSHSNTRSGSPITSSTGHNLPADLQPALKKSGRCPLILNLDRLPLKSDR